MTAAGFWSELKPKAWQVLAGDSAAGRLQDSALPELTATHQAPGRPSRFKESFTCNHCACTPLSFQHAKLKYRRVVFFFAEVAGTCERRLNSPKYTDKILAYHLNDPSGKAGQVRQ